MLIKVSDQIKLTFLSRLSNCYGVIGFVIKSLIPDIIAICRYLSSE